MEKSTRYDNGELVTKPRMEDEDWYPEYQRLLEMSCYGTYTEVDTLYEEILERIERYKEVSEEDKKRFLRWSSFQVERSRSTCLFLKDRDTEKLRDSILTLLESDIGFDIHICGTIYIRSLESKEIAVGGIGLGWEETFDPKNKEKAINLFFTKRHELKLGEDY